MTTCPRGTTAAGACCFNSATPRGRGMTTLPGVSVRNHEAALQFGHAQRAWDDHGPYEPCPNPDEEASIRPRPEGVG